MTVKLNSVGVSLVGYRPVWDRGILLVKFSWSVTFTSTGFPKDARKSSCSNTGDQDPRVTGLGSVSFVRNE